MNCFCLLLTQQRTFEGLSDAFSYFSLFLLCSPHLLPLMQQLEVFFFPPLPVRVFSVCVCVHPCVCINGSITISYRCNQWWVSIKVFAWELRGSKTRAGGLTRSGMHRHSLIHGHSVRQCGVQTHTLLQNTASLTSPLGT